MKKIIASVLTFCILFALAACGSNDNVGGGTDAVGGNGAQSNPGGEQTVGNSGENVDKDGGDFVPVGNLTYGNEPNNLYQRSNAPCFGDGNAYFINSESEIVSVPLDGGSEKTVGAIGGLTKYSWTPCCINWYQGSVYYVVVWDREDSEGRYIEIRSMNVSTGEESVVLTCEDNDYNSCGRMLIIGDNLFYECYNLKNNSTAIKVFDLKDSKENQIVKKTVSSFANPTIFAADSRYVYIMIDGAGIFRTPWSGIYGDEPECEKLVDESVMKNTMIITDEGFYAVIIDSDGNRNFVHYKFDSSAADWPYETVASGLSDGSPESESEDPAGSLIYYADGWMLNGSYSAYLSGAVYISQSADFTQSKSAGELVLAYEDIMHPGAYDGTLYIIVEGSEGLSLHTLTADGTYQ